MPPISPAESSMIVNESVVIKVQASKVQASKPKTDKKTALLAKKVEDSISKISNGDELLKFFDSESKLRKTDRKSAVTKKLDQAQWKEVKIHFKTGLNGNVKAKQFRKMKQKLVSWILNPEHKGLNKS